MTLPSRELVETLSRSAARVRDARRGDLAQPLSQGEWILQLEAYVVHFEHAEVVRELLEREYRR